jgi:hypothetical protein
MISSTALRVASRRVVGRSIQQQSARGFSSATTTAFAKTSGNNASKALLLTAGLAAAVAVLQDREDSKTYNFFGKSSAQLVKETEEKFGTYWPRNILILL